MRRTLRVGSIALLVAVSVVGCGGDDTTTIVNETTTTVAETSSTTDSTATAATSTTSTADDGSTLSLKAFQSPSGNIACVMTPDYARCDIAERSWTPPAAPADCELDYGQGIQLPADGPATLVCAGDTVLNPDAPVLEYGSSSQVGTITCRSTEAAMQCENASGASFSLSREGYDLG